MRTLNNTEWGGGGGLGHEPFLKLFFIYAAFGYYKYIQWIINIPGRLVKRLHLAICILPKDKEETFWKALHEYIHPRLKLLNLILHSVHLVPDLTLHLTQLRVGKVKSHVAPSLGLHVEGSLNQHHGEQQVLYGHMLFNVLRLGYTQLGAEIEHVHEVASIVILRITHIANMFHFHYLRLTIQCVRKPSCPLSNHFQHLKTMYGKYMLLTYT